MKIDLKYKKNIVENNQKLAKKLIKRVKIEKN